ncbi:transposase [Candidatus Shapirobacteria bacterium CG06_land_8_20_14_3_00_40_12]|uniref:Transposase n=2 Tax=Candidatus Shapironibacteriota TaxID=1752721 RepID=A0A2M7TRR8_9BACT|nr:MAG: transposase [Candidatus Shapirobacteria bacterium CG06_land_8_20_14_3_00_40_12]PIZ58090.1 MAG: transposase [Candidatus Shapirobacteria bacterium CG_4_10_14_0_2_um_filter_40_12]
MEKKFGDKFRIKSGRLKNWDYSSPGIYFVTICTLNHNNFLGEINNGVVILSEKGLIVEENLRKISAIYPFVLIDKYVVMPNHVHLLINITMHKQVETCHWRVSTEKLLSQKKIGQNNKAGEAIKYWKGNSLGSIINQFKMSCTKEIRKLGLFFAWQSRYFDEIVGDEKRYWQIINYIKNNPKDWGEDKLFRNE